MASNVTITDADKITPLFELSWDSAGWSLTLTVSVWVLGIIFALIVGILVWRYFIGGFFSKKFEIDKAEMSIGKQKISFKPNVVDKQIAYAIWVELSTRKIGLPIDFENDVIIEIYNSWYSFFAITRNLIKEIPASKLKRDSTQKVIGLSIDILNEGVRPHLTKWQARFRHWYDQELVKYENGDREEILDPQLLQAKFPKYNELKKDMESVNQTLIKYQKEMYRLALNG